MRPWLIMLGGLCVWAAHFVVIWTGASLFLTSPAARLVTGGATLAALAGIALLVRMGRPTPSQDQFTRWSANVALLSALAAAIAIVWQALPALLI
jgi:hypothetical protein